MGRIDRYLLSQLLAVFGMASLVLIGVYGINRAVMLFDQLIADGQSAWVFLEFTALVLPAIVRIVLPLAAFAATLWAINRLGADSELAAVQATGVSPWRLARPVLAFGLIVALLVAALAHVLAPAAARRLAAREADIAETATARFLREGEFVSPVAGLTLYIRDLSPEGELRDLLLSDNRDAGNAATYTAASAYLVRGPDGPQLVMIDGLIQRLDRDTGRIVATSFSDLAYDLGPLMGAAEPGQRRVRELSTWDLLNPTPALAAETGRDQGTLRAEGHERLAEPLLSPVGALLAFATLMLGPWGRLGAWRRIVGAVVLVIAVKGVESVALAAVGEDPGRWPLLYLPSLAGLGVAAALLWVASGTRPCPPAASRAPDPPAVPA